MSTDATFNICTPDTDVHAVIDGAYSRHQTVTAGTALKMTSCEACQDPLTKADGGKHLGLVPGYCIVGFCSC